MGPRQRTAAGKVGRALTARHCRAPPPRLTGPTVHTQQCPNLSSPLGSAQSRDSRRHARCTPSPSPAPAHPMQTIEHYHKNFRCVLLVCGRGCVAGGVPHAVYEQRERVEPLRPSGSGVTDEVSADVRHRPGAVACGRALSLRHASAPPTEVPHDVMRASNGGGFVVGLVALGGAGVDVRYTRSPMWPQMSVHLFLGLPRSSPLLPDPTCPPSQDRSATRTSSD